MAQVVKEKHECSACQGTGVIVKERPVLSCEVCEKAYVQQRKDQLTCSAKCKHTLQARRYRARKREAS